ncbi:MAG: acyl-CoA thioesterase [Bacteroidota bacterium]|nr:acyl-CoA thioesterase [Bacteroidota bacterium]
MNSPAPDFPFAFQLTVLPEHIDDQQHVNNVVYVQFMQEVANRHWQKFVTPELDNTVVWVVRKHEVEYLAPAYLNEVLEIRTWTGEHTAVTWNRHYEIIRPSDQKIICKAQSVWVLLDKASGKPRRIEEAILRVFLK